MLEGGELFVWTQGEWYKITMTQADSGIGPDSNAKVSNAGSAVCNGTYSNNGTVWNKGGQGNFLITKSTAYPTPGVVSWILASGTDIYYVAPETTYPWDAVWVKGSFGADPAPTVVGLPKVETRRHATKSRKQ
jgi:hypothetical protein